MTIKQTAITILVFSFFFLFLHNAKTLSESNPSPISPFKEIKLEAKSAYVFDLVKNETIFEMNADTSLPLASLTKIMTAIVALENTSPDQDLLSVMLISSSNDAAAALSAGSGFVPLMNKKAEELDLGQTSFLNTTGLDVSVESAGAYGSARDVTKLMEYFVKNYPKVAEVTRYESVNINSQIFKNTDKLAERLPGIIAGKTGSTDLAGGNLAVVIDIGLGHPVIIVVLGSTEEGRFEDVEDLYEATVKSLTSK